MSTSKIEWTDAVWNPIVGCTRVSEGCRHCYAERMALRLQSMGTRGYDGVVDQHGRWTGRVNVVDAAMGAPLDRTKPTTYFVNSMSDLFHRAVDNRTIGRVIDIMQGATQHQFVVLTKRPKRMRDVLRDVLYCNVEHVWWGFSAEHQATFDERWAVMREVAAAGFNVVCSAEPLLGVISAEDGLAESARLLSGVIVGGESGPGARPMHPDWARSLRDQCAAAGVPFFFKQWGEWAPLRWQHTTTKKDDVVVAPDGMSLTIPEDGWFPAAEMGCAVLTRRVGKRNAGRVLDGRTHDELPWRAK